MSAEHPSPYPHPSSGAVAVILAFLTVDACTGGSCSGERARRDDQIHRLEQRIEHLETQRSR